MASNDNQPNSSDNMSRNRRSSVTSAALSSIFRSASTSTASTGTPIFPNPLDPNRRRVSVSTTAALGLGSVPGSANSVGSASNSAGPSGVGASAFALRRASLSTNSSASDAAVDESAIEDDDAPPIGARNAPNSPYGRRLSFGAPAVRSHGRQRSLFATAPNSVTGTKQSQQPSPASPTTSGSPLHSSPTAPVPFDSYFPPSLSSAHRASALKSGSFSHFSSSSSSSAPRSPSSQVAFAPVYSPRTVSDKVFFPATRADQGYNWPEQLRSRAESTISGARSSFSHASGMGNSPPRVSGFAGYGGFGGGGVGGGGGGGGGGVGNGGGVGAARHDRAKSVSDVPRQAPVPTQPAPRREARKKPDPFQERILKGDFYMD